jgi:cytochrome b
VSARPGEGWRSVRVWDAPVRIFHWLLVLGVLVQWQTGQSRALDTHMQTGVALTGLLLFRLIWGLLGTQTARFADFLKGPGAILAYLRGRRAHGLGHNPLGGWSVAAMLAVLLAQCALGLVAQDVDGMYSGPLSQFVSYDLSEAARRWHHRLFDLLVGLVALHLLAILWYLLVRGDNLVSPMIDGRREVPAGVAEPARAARVALPVALLVPGALVLWIWAGAPVPEALGG